MPVPPFPTFPPDSLPFQTVPTSKGVGTNTDVLGGFVTPMGDQIPFYSDVDGSYGQTVSSLEGSNKAQRKVLCNWVDKDQMILVFLGYVDPAGNIHPPLFFPGTNLYCQTVTVAGYGKMVQDSSGVLQYTVAELTLDFTGQAISSSGGGGVTVLYDEEISVSERLYTINQKPVKSAPDTTKGVYVWDNDPGVPINPNTPIPSIKELILDVKLHFYRRQSLNPALFNNVGLINSDTVTMKTTGIDFPVETLLFLTTTYKRSVSLGPGGSAYDFTIHLQHRVARTNTTTNGMSTVSWNEFFNPGAGEYDTISLKADGSSGGADKPMLPYGTPVSFSFLTTI